MAEGRAETVINFFKQYWWIVVLAVLFSVVIFLWPLVGVHRTKGWIKLSAWATYAYTVVTFITFLIISITVIFAARQVSIAKDQLLEASRIRKMNAILELSKFYATPEMFEAVKTIFSYPLKDIEKILDDPEKDYHRRLVTAFWNQMVGWPALEGLIDPKFVSYYWGRTIQEIYERLIKLEFAVRLRIEKRDFDDEKARERANYYINHILRLKELYEMVSADIPKYPE